MNNVWTFSHTNTYNLQTYTDNLHSRASCIKSYISCKVKFRKNHKGGTFDFVNVRRGELASFNKLENWQLFKGGRGGKFFPCSLNETLGCIYNVVEEEPYITNQELNLT